MSDREASAATIHPTPSAESPGGRTLSLQERVRSLRLPETGSAPRRAPVLPWALCAVFFTTSAGLAYVVASHGLTSAVADPSGVTASVGESKPAASASRLAEAGEILLESKGYIIPAHQILVSPKVNGMIVKLHFDKLREGQRVPQGAPLAEIEDVEYRAEAARARANLDLATQKWEELKTGSRPEEIAEAWNQWKEAERQLEQFKTTFDRNVNLRNRNVLSPQDFDQSKTDYEAAQKRTERLENTWKLVKIGPRQERIAAAWAEVELAQAELTRAEWRLGNCVIRAPVSGTILKKNAEEGNIVNPVAFNGSFSLCEMADLSDLEVDLSIQERDVSRVFQRQRCRVRAEAFPERVYEGYVSRLMPIADRAKGAVPVRVKVKVPSAEEGVYLKPEMGAIVAFLNESVDAARFAALPSPVLVGSAADAAKRSERPPSGPIFELPAEAETP